jgi:IS1 family transposase
LFFYRESTYSVGVTINHCLALKALLAPLGIRRFYMDGWGAYQWHLEPYQHVVGKRRTQQLERKHLTSARGSNAW